MTSLILVIYIWKRETPIVRSSDKYLSFLHILTLLLLPALSTYPKLYKQITLEKCIAQNLILSVLYTFNVGFMQTKSQKLLTAYLSKVRVTRKQFKVTIGVQIFTILIYLIAINSILGITYFQENKDAGLFRCFWCTYCFQNVARQLTCHVQRGN